ncbi:hypothetical protein [Sinomonas albida]|uniref:hypothetical protein n=1 Tax=Sinomonas albida TaxID=369942 RepID=UPI00301B59EE
MSSPGATMQGGSAGVAGVVLRLWCGARGPGNCCGADGVRRLAVDQRAAPDCAALPHGEHRADPASSTLYKEYSLTHPNSAAMTAALAAQTDSRAPGPVCRDAAKDRGAHRPPSTASWPATVPSSAAR